MKDKWGILIFDVHLNNSYAKPYQLVKNFIKENKPDFIILGGDYLDCSSLSHWLETNRREMEGLRYRKEIDFAAKELDYLQTYCNDITYLIGNHEDWIEQFINKNPQVEGWFELKVALNLLERNIKLIPLNELYKIGKLFVTHGFYTNMFSTKKHLLTLGCNICYGHTHVSQVYMCNMKMQAPLKAWSIGCLCDFAPSYLKGKPANWINQFAILYVSSTGLFNLYPIDIIHNSFIWNNKKYSL